MTRPLIAVRIARKRREAQDICSFELIDPDGRLLPPFSAGAHIDVHVRPGVIRQYSLCSGVDERQRYLIAVLRDPSSRGGSRAMHEELQPGDVVQISQPRNHFGLASAERSLLLAGGIGITPILCMTEHLARRGADFELHYCTRSPERTAFREHITNSSFADRVHFHFDSGSAEQRLDIAVLLARPAAHTHIYVCGPTPFIDIARATATASGWAPSNVHFELFSAAPTVAGNNEAFEVQIARTGEIYAIPPDRTVLDVLREQGMSVPSSCEQGICGACLTGVLSGVPDHRDHFLTDAEHAQNTHFTPCCSRARSPRLVLDL